MNPYRRLPALSAATAVVVVVVLPSVAYAQASPGQNAAAFAAILPGLIALATQVTTAIRDALTTDVPPVWLKANPTWRPWLAAGVGAVVAALMSLTATSSTGGDPLTSGALATAALAALANLAVALPKLIYTERQATSVRTLHEFVHHQDAPAPQPAPKGAS